MKDIPIPKEILIHTAQLRVYSDSGIMGSPVLTEETPLLNVRVELSRSAAEDERGRRLCPAGILYFDCVNSGPEDVLILRDECRSTVVFEGREMPVTGIKYIYGASGLHHLEVSLGGE